MNYIKLYESIIEKRKLHIPTGYVEEHHIIPRCLGGADDKDNLVKLTAKEHFICHLLLTKMYHINTIEYYKMCHAFLMMLVKGNGHKENRYITSRKYEKLKVSFSERMSVLQSGKSNSQYGTMWIFNPLMEENKKIGKYEIIESGWYKGRINNWISYHAKQLKKKEKEDKKKQKDIIKSVKVNKHKMNQNILNDIDWDFMYELYQMYGFTITSNLTGYNKTRESMLMQFKKRVKNYRPTQKTKKINDEYIFN